MDLPDVGGVLGRQVGPFTVGTWLLVGGAGIGLGLLIRRRLDGGRTVEAPADDLTAYDPSLIVPTTAGYTTAGAGVVGGGQPSPPQPVAGGSTGTPAEDNAAWSQRAQTAGIAAGYDPVAVAAAVSRYLYGMDLTPQQAAILSDLLRRVGPPPEPVGPPVTTGPIPMPSLPPVTVPDRPPAPTMPRAPAVPAQPKPTPPARPATRTYTVKPGDNLTRIAQAHGFGTNWRPIYDANRAVIGVNPDLIKPGQVLVIPAR